ncbi:hypothetical protein [Pseudomonas fulva]|uniref:hypothetical protein n=1 Tax=Pseudomonas fulva TaxID=47880 RepID=UPI0018A8C912|nr:hypothetical protein [Pseudomonas fulva]MBF8677672.1 hypothetical protein [Pseudomonas fulva]MBF8719800.1 hypothetical protein [Pseudomonas fulva]MBF8786007.1 hypothetical protein [Pseudomonas fulva]
MEIRFEQADENAHDTIFKLLQDEGHQVDKIRMDHNFNVIESDGNRLIDQRESDISLLVDRALGKPEKQAFDWLNEHCRLCPAKHKDVWFYALCACGVWTLLRSPYLVEDASFIEAAVLLGMNLLSTALFVLAYLIARTKSRQDTSGQAFGIRKNKLFWAGTVLVALLFLFGLVALIDAPELAAVSLLPIISLGTAAIAFHKARYFHTLEALQGHEVSA